MSENAGGVSECVEEIRCVGKIKSRVGKAKRCVGKCRKGIIEIE